MSFAEILGVNPTIIRKWENGSSKPLKYNQKNLKKVRYT
jgi:DNA-binding transcriptional regulator YiaG